MITNKFESVNGRLESLERILKTLLSTCINYNATSSTHSLIPSTVNVTCSRSASDDVSSYCDQLANSTASSTITNSIANEPVVRVWINNEHTAPSDSNYQLLPPHTVPTIVEPQSQSTMMDSNRSKQQ
jgi:hypothetical protein